MWEALAVQKYWQAIVNATIHHYGGNHREMLEDDNVRGSVPTLRLNDAIPWIHNSPKYFFMCLLIELRHHRDSNELRLYLDARGEADLRHPGDSSIERRPRSEKAAGGESGSVDLISGEFVPEVSMPGHHRGYLSFDAGQFSTPGRYFFTFCDIRRNAHFRRLQIAMEARGVPMRAILPVIDYSSVMLLEVTEEGGLERAFANASLEGKVRYALPTSPFQDESEEVEMRRFAPHLNEELMRRHEIEEGKKWWVNSNENVEAVPQRFIMLSPSGAAVTGTFSQRGA